MPIAGTMPANRAAKAGVAPATGIGAIATSRAPRATSARRPIRSKRRRPIHRKPKRRGASSAQPAPVARIEEARHRQAPARPREPVDHDSSHLPAFLLRPVRGKA